MSILIDQYRKVLEHEDSSALYLENGHDRELALEQLLRPMLRSAFVNTFEQVVALGEARLTVVEDYQIGDDQRNLHLMVTPGSVGAKKSTFIVLFQPVLPAVNFLPFVDKGPKPVPSAGSVIPKNAEEKAGSPHPASPWINEHVRSLQQKYDHFKNIINNIPGAVIRYQINTDGSDKLIYLSDQAASLWEVDGEEALKNVQKLWEPILKEDLPMMQASIMRSAQELSIWRNQWRIRTKSGMIKWLEATGNPSRTEEGAIYWDTLIMDVTVKKQAEIELAKKTLLLERTESVASIGSWEWDIVLDQVKWSAEVFRIFGMPLQDRAPGLKEQAPYYSAPSFQKLLDVIDRAIQYGEPYEVEVTLHPQKDTRRYCICRGIPQKDPHGQVTHLYGSFQDITRLKETEISLRESREMLHKIADNIPGIVYRYQLFPDGTDRLLFLSKRVKSLLGVAQEEALKNTRLLWECIHPDDLELYRQSVEKSARELAFWQIEHRIIMPNGRTKWIKGLGQPHQHEDGSIIWDSMGIDITEQKEASEKLRAVKNQLDLAIEIAELGVFSYDLSLDQLDLSPRAKNILGLDNDAIPANLRTIYQLLVPKDRKQAKSAFQDNFSGNKIANLQLRIRKASGQTGYLSISSVPMWKNGQVTQILGIVYDITQFKNTEHDLSVARDKAEQHTQSPARKNQELQKANEELDHFVYSTSHNLRAPLASILGLTALMQQEYETEDQLKLVGYIEKSIHRLDETIREITTYSKNNRLASTRQSVNLPLLIQEVIQSLSYMQHASRLHIGCDFPENFQLISDAFRLRIIFENLISNAIKYQNLEEEKPYLRMSLNILKNKVLIRVEDNGIGIKPAYVRKVFEMFFRGINQGSGSGLGLYIVQEAVAKLEGAILLKSEYGVGTKFEIHLPV